MARPFPCLRCSSSECRYGGNISPKGPEMSIRSSYHCHSGLCRKITENQIKSLLFKHVIKPFHTRQCQNASCHEVCRFFKHRRRMFGNSCIIEQFDKIIHISIYVNVSDNCIFFPAGWYNSFQFISPYWIIGTINILIVWRAGNVKPKIVLALYRFSIYNLIILHKYSISSVVPHLIIWNLFTVLSWYAANRDISSFPYLHKFHK